jgi:hypothetical protein
MGLKQMPYEGAKQTDLAKSGLSYTIPHFYKFPTISLTYNKRLLLQGTIKQIDLRN